MSKSGQRAGRQKHGHVDRGSDIKRTPVGDGQVVVGLVLIGLAIAFFVWLVIGDNAREILFGLAAVFAFLISTSAFAAIAGRKLPPWRQALARVPLRFAGYRKFDGKPLTAAHGQSDARRAAIVCVVVSIIVLAALAYFLLADLWT